MKILIVSELHVSSLCNSYIRALQKMNYEVKTFDPYQSQKKYIRLGKIGQKIQAFWPVYVWMRKANRELAILFKNFKPDKVIVFGNAPVLFSTLAFFKSISDCQLILYWPDTLTNLEQNQANGARLYDVVATYSSATIPVFKQMGFKDAVWCPFAGDIDFLGDYEDKDEFLYDVSFAGGWRPERENAMAAVVDAFPHLKIFIRGLGWKRNCRDKKILTRLSATPLFGKDFGNFFRNSRISINVIDDTNYPAANMRFFEIPAAGGLQISSACPEMEQIFKNKEHILYFSDTRELIAQIDFAIKNPDKSGHIRKHSHQFIKEYHNYKNRLTEIFNS